MSIVIRERAASDILELTDYFQSYRAKTAIKFARRLRKALLMLERTPLAGADLGIAESGIRIRFLAIKGFRNHLILYVPIPNGIELTRVVDGPRDWKTLLSNSS